MPLRLDTQTSPSHQPNAQMKHITPYSFFGKNDAMFGTSHVKIDRGPFVPQGDPGTFRSKKSNEFSSRRTERRSRAIARLRSEERAYLGVQAAMSYACDGKAERTTLPNDLDATDWSPATSVHDLVDTKQLWMGTHGLRCATKGKQVDPNERSHTAVVAQKKT